MRQFLFFKYISVFFLLRLKCYPFFEDTYSKETQFHWGVVSGNGIVGIVYQTSAHYAIVLPVLNSKSSISCKIRRTDYFGSLKWSGGSSLYAWLRDIPRHSEFSLGDTVVTSGHSAVFPEGIPVGMVDDIMDSRDGLSYVLKVKLFSDVARLNDVNVISARGQSEQAVLEDNIK